MTYRYSRLDDHEGLDGGPRFEIDDHHNFTICVVDDEDTARLFTAAPDLLEALEMAVQALNTAPRFKVPQLECDSYRIAAICDAALAKAKGGAA